MNRPSTGQITTISAHETRAASTVPHWFGIGEANEEYRRVADRCPTHVANANGQAVGFLTVVHHSAHAAELHVLAVRPELHRRGVGRLLVGVAEDRLRSEHVEYLQVKTLSASAADGPYRVDREF